MDGWLGEGDSGRRERARRAVGGWRLCFDRRRRFWFPSTSSLERLAKFPDFTAGWVWN